MDIKELHAKFKDGDSPSVEGQIRWLQNQGFQQHQIDQAMVGMYTDIEQGKLTFPSGLAMDQYLLERAKQIRTEELSAYVVNLEAFERKMRAKWEAEMKAKEVKPWYKRIFGK